MSTEPNNEFHPNEESGEQIGSQPARTEKGSHPSEEAAPILGVSSDSVPLSSSLAIPAAPSPLNPSTLEKFCIKDEGTIESVKISAPPQIRKPSKGTWFRTFPDETAWKRYFTYSPDDGMGNLYFVVALVIAKMIGSVAVQKCMVPCMTTEGQLFFWPLTISDRTNTWAESARVIAADAMKEWRRIEADMPQKRYQAWRAVNPLPEPTWPTVPEIEEQFVRALEGKIIDDPKHPEVAKLLMA